MEVARRGNENCMVEILTCPLRGQLKFESRLLVSKFFTKKAKADRTFLAKISVPQ